jgi:hypothetical protein
VATEGSGGVGGGGGDDGGGGGRCGRGAGVALVGKQRHPRPSTMHALVSTPLRRFPFFLPSPRRGLPSATIRPPLPAWQGAVVVSLALLPVREEGGAMKKALRHVYLRVRSVFTLGGDSKRGGGGAGAGGEPAQDNGNDDGSDDGNDNNSNNGDGAGGGGDDDDDDNEDMQGGPRSGRRPGGEPAGKKAAEQLLHLLDELVSACVSD